MNGNGVTIKDVARLANVSVATVSRALNGRENVGEAVRSRVLAIANSLDYSPDPAARSLSCRRTNTIGVVLPDLPCEFFALLMCGIDAAARERGLQLLVSGHHKGVASQAEALRAMRGRVDGVLVMSPHSGRDVAAANLPPELPLLLLDSDADEPRLDNLRVDNHAGAVAMVRHLVDCGYRRIAFVAGREPHFDASERLRGYRDALRECLPGARPWIVPGNFDVLSGRQAGTRLLQSAERPDAVFAANDMMALGCLFAFQEAGLVVPDEVAVAGFNDSPTARHAFPALTTMRIDVSGFGARALHMLLDRRPVAEGALHEGALQLLQPQLVVRGSTRLSAAR